ncbi:MAG: DUF4339 domain-containing protein [Hyphomicrobium sp.]|nr:DUF4339 domain-containing protein [Hyphomicrobium sp.]
MQSGWYYSINGVQSGPVTLEALKQLALDGQLKHGDFVWTDGMAGWEPASSIDKLWPQPATRPPSLPPRIVATQVRRQPALASSASAIDRPGVRAASTGSWIERHWRGELSLPISYWVVGVLLSFAFGLLVGVYAELLKALALSQVQTKALIGAFLAFMGAFGVWQFVGIWRSAGHHMIYSKSEWRRFWAILARILTAIGALQVAYTILILLAGLFEP